MTSKLALALAAGLVAGIACGGGDSGGGGTGPTGAAEVALEVTVPPGITDGAIFVLVTGGQVPQVLSRGGIQFRAVGTGTSSVHILARGSLQGRTVVAAVCIPSASALGNYSVQVVQAAAGQAGGYAKRDVAAYSARLDQGSLISRASC